MSLRERLKRLECLVKPPTCIYRKMPPNTGGIGDFILASRGDEEAKQRLAAWDALGECKCAACEKKRRENDADPKCQKLRRFLEKEYGKYDATTHVRECGGPVVAG